MQSFTTTFEEFQQQMIAAGFEEVLERRWEAGTTVPLHSHPFEAKAVVTKGLMWLTEQGGEARLLVPGDQFHLRADVAHEERYGPQGATYWVARRA